MVDSMEVGDFIVAMHILQLFRVIWFNLESSNCSLPPQLYPVAQLIFIIKKVQSPGNVFIVILGCTVCHCFQLAMVCLRMRGLSS